MTRLNKQAFQKIADAISTDFVSGNVALNDSVIKVAKQLDMTHEQIHRLCEATNNSTFSKMFKQEKEASDRNVEFPVADASQVLRNFVEDATTKTASAPAPLRDRLPLDLPNWRHTGELPPLSKTAETDPPFELRKYASDTQDEDQRTRRKLCDHLRHTKIAAAIAYEDAVDTLKDDFRALYPTVSFSEFEKTAVALHGARAVPVLDRVRLLLRMPAVNYDVSGMQKNAGVLDDTAPPFQKLCAAMDCATQRDNLVRGLQRVEEML